jgi:hypothetical protein
MRNGASAIDANEGTNMDLHFVDELTCELPGELTGEVQMNGQMNRQMNRQMNEPVYCREGNSSSCHTSQSRWLVGEESSGYHLLYG